MLEVVNLRRSGLAPVSLSLAAGECVAVQGPSGAGKSLMLRAIADLDVNDGEVSLDGVGRDAVSGPQWRRQVGYVPAEPGWWADRVGEHFRDWAALLPWAERLLLPAEAAAWPMTRPSTGERCRLALLRALEMAPRMLLLDEPTAALDPLATAAVEALVGERVAAGLGVLWVTHDAVQAARVAGRILRISQGRLE
ncbi:MAG TPA: ATP-binding cassette domain-containing protein [Rhodospirillaceae bacterium]|nr:ATP-binding cassette domain-containing protein [Rhodospirillaceae bacterium]